MTVRSCGISSLRFPRKQLVTSACRDLCKRLVERWRSEAAPEERERIEQRAGEIFRLSPLREAPLLAHFQNRASALLGKDRRRFNTPYTASMFYTPESSQRSDVPNTVQTSRVGTSTFSASRRSSLLATRSLFEQEMAHKRETTK